MWSALLFFLPWLVAGKSPRCPVDCQAYDTVRTLQEAMERDLQRCRFKEAQQLTLPSFTFSTIENGCEPATCCLLNGVFETFTSRFVYASDLLGSSVCGDQLTFMIPQADYMSHYDNGTIVVNKWATTINPIDRTILTAFNYRFHWTPDCNCEYKLSYLDGNSMQCPTFISGLEGCVDCTLGVLRFIQDLQAFLINAQLDNKGLPQSRRWTDSLAKTFDWEVWWSTWMQANANSIMTISAKCSILKSPLGDVGECCSGQLPLYIFLILAIMYGSAQGPITYKGVKNGRIEVESWMTFTNLHVTELVQSPTTRVIYYISRVDSQMLGVPGYTIETIHLVGPLCDPVPLGGWGDCSTVCNSPG